MECIGTVYVGLASRSIDIMRRVNGTYSYWLNRDGYLSYYKSLESMIIERGLSSETIKDIIECIEEVSSCT